MTRFITIDWGGTTLKGAVWTGNPQETTFFSAPGGNLRATSVDELRKTIQVIVDWLPREPAGAETHWVIGAAGAQDHDEERFRQTVRTIQPTAGSIQLIPDFSANHHAAFAGEDGILTINGTGSVRFGRHQTREERSGGWGYLLEETPGGAVLGRFALQGFLAWLEGEAMAKETAEQVQKDLGDSFDRKAILASLYGAIHLQLAHHL